MYADDLLGIAASAEDLQDLIITPSYQHSRSYHYRANVPKCGTMICGPAPVDAPVTFMWGDKEIPLVEEYTHLGVTHFRWLARGSFSARHPPDQRKGDGH
jgi:hypothetical protein